LAAKLCETGLLRLNEQPVRKPAQPVKAGDRLEVPRGKFLLAIVIRAPGIRRGPAHEAAELYHEPDPGRRRPITGDAWEPLLELDPRGWESRD
ncbi:hypothetical protein ABTM87_18965, partial [Acinetobacter baumannii]